jgi:CRP/FNR family transcriptional regulator, anaerobic regulatory protein
MTSLLQQHIQKFVSIPDEDMSGILAYFTPIQLRKKENLLVEGNVCHSNYFVVKGCLRMFYINDKGDEQTIQFALENWWMADYDSFSNQKPGLFSMQAVERSEVLALHYQAQEKMLQQYPVMERYYRLVHQRAHAASQRRIRGQYNYSREDQYLNFARQYPEFVQRVPQYLLASFLGFTPEYLSEIRAKKRS